MPGVLWALLFGNFVIGTGVTTWVEPPVGWRITDRRKRTDHDGGVYWTVVEPA